MEKNIDLLMEYLNDHNGWGMTRYKITQYFTENHTYIVPRLVAEEEMGMVTLSDRRNMLQKKNALWCFLESSIEVPIYFSDDGKLMIEFDQGYIEIESIH
jgi:hypothetical protein